jgi:DNA-damage-inducible protein J
MDKEVKRGMDETCKELGLNMTTAINIFARKMSRERRIPFEVSIDPFYSKTNQARLEEAMRDLDEGKNIVSKTMEELEAKEIMNYEC